MFDFFKSDIVITCGNYCTCAIKTTTMLQLVYNVHTCDHAMCPHSKHLLWNTFTTIFFIMIPIKL